MFTAYPPAVPEEERERQPTPAPKPEKEEIPDILIPMGVEEGRPASEKNEAFESDLESVYRDALAEPLPYLETQEMASPEDTGPWDRDAGPEEEEEILERDMEPFESTPPKKHPSKSRMWLVLLLIFLMLAAGAAAVVYLRPGWMEPYLTSDWMAPYLALLRTPEKEKPAEPGVRLLQFDSVAGSFVDTVKAGQLFVIRGMVQSQYPQPRSHLLVKGSILDNKGKVVDSRVSYAGNTFTEEEIKTLPIAEVLKALQNPDGMARQNFNVPSGASIPFMVVFQNLPDNMSEFAVEAVSSSPGA